MIPEIHPLSFFVRSTPPTLLMHYYLGDKKTEELSHQIKLYISKDATATQVANDLARTENVYLGEKVIPRKKLEDLIEMIISNMNKPTGKFMFLSN